MRRWTLSLLGGFLVFAVTSRAASHTVTLLMVEEDPRLDRSRIERGYLGHPGGPAADGLDVALREAQLELQAAGTGVGVARVRVGSAQAARVAALNAQKAGHVALVADLPSDWLLAVTDATKVPVVNVGDASNRLRERDCRGHLLHVLPSERMRADALAQTLVARKWLQVLLLTGPSTLDRERAAVAQAAIKRYGLRLVASRPFKLSTDPRERELANPLLLTRGAYDAVWVVDSDGEFARSLPYRTVCCRARWSATPGWWRSHGTRSSSATARRRSRVASPGRRIGPWSRTIGPRGWPARRWPPPPSRRRRESRPPSPGRSRPPCWTVRRESA
jgi:hypothetical protein